MTTPTVDSLTDVTVSQFIEKLEECVNERGRDYVYTTPQGNTPNPDAPGAGCMYVHGNKPGCIIGCALHKLGVSLDYLRSQENSGAYVVILRLASSRDVPWVASAAQSRQDSGQTWGEALDAAKQNARKRGYEV